MDSVIEASAFPETAKLFPENFRGAFSETAKLFPENFRGSSSAYLARSERRICFLDAQMRMAFQGYNARWLVFLQSK